MIRGKQTHNKKVEQKKEGKKRKSESAMRKDVQERKKYTKKRG